MFGKVENPKNEKLLDLSQRELVTFAPLLVLAVWIGIYPAPFLRRLETSVRHVVSRVSPEYEAKYLANCDPTPTAAKVAASDNPAAKFLSAVPCDPVTGQPLTTGQTPAPGSAPSPERKPENR